MKTASVNSPVSRRSMIRGAAGLGMFAPIALAAPGVARADNDEGTHDYSKHLAVGVWSAGGKPRWEYDIAHADGTFFHYIPYLGYVTNQGDPKLPSFGFGVWRPTGERTFEAAYRYAWADNTVTSVVTVGGEATIDDTGDRYTVRYWLKMVDDTGKVIIEDVGISDPFTRLRLEDLLAEAPGAEEATPST